MTQINIKLDDLNEFQLAVLASIVSMASDAKSCYAVERELFALVGRDEGKRMIDEARPVNLDALK